MIPDAAITHRSVDAPWPTRTQVEQDLLLSRLICEISADPYLGDELVFRGGTCFHKLHLSPARRYSEDLDYAEEEPRRI
jgi:predicted nucleotidyltransferase component of viral defense system